MTPDDAELPESKVNGNFTDVSGTAGANEFAEFRIGLQQKFSIWHETSNPARYAFLIFVYGTPLKAQKIFLRQGEGPDYVMRPEDPGAGGPWGSPNPRPEAKKFSPYNLKDPLFNTQTDHNTMTDVYTGLLGSTAHNGGGDFTQYPSQAGYFFKWNHSTRAFIPYSIPFANWPSSQGVPLWDPELDETCPSGYRRPNDWDNVSSGYVPSTPEHPVAGSEIRQSLWSNPPTGTASDLANSVWGFYADGYFDRRAIVPSINGVLYSTVSSGNYHVANAGRLFFNPITRASLFFPGAGFRNGTGGNLSLTGGNAFYWTNTSHSNNLAWTLSILPQDASMTTGSRPAGFNIRCVYAPCIPATDVTVVASPTSTTVGNTVTLTATPTPSNAAINTYIWQQYSTTNFMWETIATTTVNTCTAIVTEDGSNQFRVTILTDCGNATGTPVVVTGTLPPAGGSAARITWDAEAHNGMGGYVITYDPRNAGLFFRYGSVVGIYSDHHAIKNLTPPLTPSTDTYDSGDVAWTPQGTTYTWASIPYVSTGLDITESFHTAANVKAGLGDPCRLVGLDLYTIQNTAAGSLSPEQIDNKTWRLPTMQDNVDFSELGSSGSSTGAWWWAENAAGNISFGVAGAEFPTRNSSGLHKFLPAAGGRNQSFGPINDQGVYGWYWSSERYPSYTTPYMFSFNDFEAYPANSMGQMHAFPVRCVPNVCIPLSGISISPNGGTVAAGSTVDLTATPIPSGAINVTYQWQRSFDGGTTWFNVVGGNSATLAAKAVWSGVTKYKVVASNPCSGGNKESTPVDVIGTGNEPAPPEEFRTYVGAFWKDDQMGERLIRTARPSSGETDGDWGAWVMDGNWIVLDKQNSNDGNVWTSGGPNISGNDGGFETSTYQLSSTAISVTGTMSASSNIYFRIGLTGVNPTPGTPRYGMVLLTYNNHELAQRIFIRQGEDPDYVLREFGDPGTSIITRPLAQKFSPYNVTYGPFNLSGWVDIPTNNGGFFTDYPSQAGAFFQWGSQEIYYPRRAWQPHGNPSGWNSWAISGFWDDIKYSQDICPPDYRRVNDGPTAVGSNGNYNNSELRQSLWLDPFNGDSFYGSMHNFVYGYYADGFFDRRQIVDGGSYTGHGTLSTVSFTTKEIAHVGGLFFNPNTNASLFFPFIGELSFAGIYNMGTLGLYWTTAYGLSGTSSAAWAMLFSSIYDRMQINASTQSFPIRCVYDNTPWVFATPDNLNFAYNAPASQNVKGLTNQPAWTASSDQSWCSVSPSTGSTGQTFAVTCTNNSGAERTATITVSAGGATPVYVTVTQAVDPNSIPGNGTPVAGVSNYVGAFWRHDQTGERLIRIPVGDGSGPSAGNLGEWTASVVWYDGNWNESGGDGIVLAPALSPTELMARHIDFSSIADEANITPADSHPVLGTDRLVSGTVAANGYIEFRIGLQQPFAAYSNANSSPNPARYAVILLSYGTPVKLFKLYMRQGEGDDYTPGQSSGIRWSPYNLGTIGNFMTFPSQAGYVYQWCNGPTAYHPIDPLGSVPGWNTNSSGAYALGSVCPVSNTYVLPSGGTGSESKQLEALPSFRGFYADGFFDRRMIHNSLGSLTLYFSGVSINTGNLSDPANAMVAYGGHLFVSQNKSVFLPVIPGRYFNTGEVGKHDEGDDTQYWTRTLGGSFSGTMAYYFPWDTECYADQYKTYGMSVRCIRP